MEYVCGAATIETQFAEFREPMYPEACFARRGR